MAELKSFDSVEADQLLVEKDRDTLAAIDEGMKAADEGRVLPEEEVRKLIPRWISKFSTPTRR
jgi:predicted transcriptional regulator